MIVVVDFGSQTTHLITRRVRELGVESKLIEPEKFLDFAKKNKLSGIIFSGGPASVYGKNSPTIDKKVFELNIPILGICYGLQLIAHLTGGAVKPGKKKEYGPATLEVTSNSSIFHLPSSTFQVWMSHGDEVVSLPKGFKTLAKTETIPHAVITNDEKRIYAIQFHPEVVHTQFGEEILSNFISICGLAVKKQRINEETVNNLVHDIRESIGNKKAIVALSGGVDSSVASLLVHRAIGNQLTAIYIDSGLMRHDETNELRKTFEKHFHMNLKIINAKKVFLDNLKRISDPEKKRKIIGKIFIKVFEKEAKKTGAIFLVQGTIYPDVIESKGTKHSKNIKSHHNVGGLPKNMNLALVEPLRTFYKDEVRHIGKILGLPHEIIHRHPFPGPGLAIRIIGDVTEKKLKVLQKADAIVRHEVKEARLNDQIWQLMVIFTGIKTTGVRGDNRAYGETIAIRAVEARDAMSANFAHLPYPLLNKISTRIVNEITEVNRVVYDITNKPPATMEWE